jgi:L-amino acid N-acyltransferase YncA
MLSSVTTSMCASIPTSQVSCSRNSHLSSGGHQEAGRQDAGTVDEVGWAHSRHVVILFLPWHEHW